MIDRAVAQLLRRRLAQFPAVTLVGPRQCGKTTLARTLAQSYFDLEAPEVELIGPPSARSAALWFNPGR